MSRRKSWVKCTCKQCGEEFEVVPYKVKRGGGKFCSRKCFQDWSKGPDNPLRRSLIRNCEICGKEFTVKRSQAMIGKGRFCSRQCQSIWQSEDKKGKNNPAWKGTRGVRVNGEFIFTNEHGLVDKICQNCGKEFEIIPSEAKRGGGRFCSRECVNQYQQGPNHPQWKGGESERPSDKKVYPAQYKPAKKNRPGFVYFLLADNGLYKIGRTKSLKRRIMRLGIKLPYDLKLEMIIRAEDMCWLETKFHRRFSESQVRGEWFELDKNDLKYAKEFALGMLD